ncbi:response regulator [Pleurocapsa sp. PCC 7319]|uniref:GGDEF domain-containing response regulator n=1 Tax=Pleurocapsa sp. PCC 7319 TaxID=118161 RepID=UPI00034B71D1|nr:response regulator [Pleurocapsa sp. PCC 7319]
MSNIKQKQIKTLLVENNQEDAFSLRKKLADTREVRFNLTHVERLEKALQCLQQESFDVVLLDLSLPDSHGLATFLSLEEIVPNLPIVLLTTLNDESLALEAIRQGAQDYLVKEQTTINVLLRSINYAIERMHHVEKLFQSEERLQQINRELEKRVKKCTFELKYQNQELKKLFLLATTDRITGIANRYRLEDFLEREWGDAIRNQVPLSIIMIDIDRFKLYNDTYGHPQGDRCLRQVAQTIDATIKRSKDLVARYGGEEFIVILPNVDIDGAAVVAENIRSQVKALNIAHATSEISDRLTISLGVASTIPAHNSQASNLIMTADRALYFAKQHGRNRIEIYQNQYQN